MRFARQITRTVGKPYNDGFYVFAFLKKKHYHVGRILPIGFFEQFTRQSVLYRESMKAM